MYSDEQRSGASTTASLQAFNFFAISCGFCLYAALEACKLGRGLLKQALLNNLTLGVSLRVLQRLKITLKAAASNKMPFKRVRKLTRTARILVWCYPYYPDLVMLYELSDAFKWHFKVDPQVGF